MLIGMLICCLLNSAPVIEAYLSCAEKCILEVAVDADDKGDSSEIDFSVSSDEQLGAAFHWQHIDHRDVAQPDRTKRESHLVRGPPAAGFFR
jgi:hypothetical protein